MRKKIISCASFGGTGSSAITDILSEFSNIKDIGDFEFSILHEVDGISDLQHYVVDDFHRLKVSEGIYRFEKLVNNLNKEYSKYIGKSFKEISNNYIDSITKIKWKGYWHQHRYRSSKLLRIFKYTIPTVIQFRIHKILNKKNIYEYSPKFYKDDIKIAVDREEFFYYTKKYLRSLIECLDKENKYEYIALDQLLPPYNIDRYSKYFDNVKVIVVDRDPRDLFILNKMYWKEGWIPTDDVDIYIDWFKTIRGNRLKNNYDNALFIRFEDLIVNYEKTLDKIIKFLELDKKNHTKKLERFNPEKSKKNFRVWKNSTKYIYEINKIQKELAEYCYE